MYRLATISTPTLVNVMYLKNRDVDHLATSSTVLNFTLPGTIFTTVGSFGYDIVDDTPNF